jgi:hypothetical protein
MNVIETTAPICIEDLKKYFSDNNSFYLISYKDSSLRGKNLLTYLSNLDIPSDINFSGTSEEDIKSLFDDYIRLEIICNIPSLEKIMIEVIKQRKEIGKENFFRKFIKDNEDMIDLWISKLDSLTLYNLYVVDNEEFKNFVSSHPIDETDSLIGINFVSLLKHIEFYDTYQVIEKSSLKFYKKYFEDYMFKGKNMFDFWANENNMMFLLTFGISNDIVKTEEYLIAKSNAIEELRDAPSI